MGAIDTAALEIGPRSRTRKKAKSSLFWFVSSLVGTVSGKKSLKLLPLGVIFLKLKCTKFDFGWGSAPDPARELTAIPQTP